MLFSHLIVSNFSQCSSLSAWFCLLLCGASVRDAHSKINHMHLMINQAPE